MNWLAAFKATGILIFVVLFFAWVIKYPVILPIIIIAAGTGLAWWLLYSEFNSKTKNK